MEPRVKLLRFDELDEEARAAYDDFVSNSPIKGVIDSNTAMGALSEVLLHNPGVYRGNTAFAGALLRHGGLSRRQRELVTLRVTWLCQAPVSWSNHVGHAHEAGITPSEVERVTIGPDADEWSPEERALLRMVDDLHSSATVSDAVWAELMEYYDLSQLVALPMLVGLYHQISFTFNALGVPVPDPSRRGLSAR
jgi:alkylhydroperoxidase family enzyme